MISALEMAFPRPRIPVSEDSVYEATVYVDKDGRCLGDNTIKKIKLLRNIGYERNRTIVQCEASLADGSGTRIVVGKFSVSSQSLIEEARTLTAASHANIVNCSGVYKIVPSNNIRKRDRRMHNAIVLLMDWFPTDLKKLLEEKDYTHADAENWIVPQIIEGVRFIHEEMFVPDGAGLHRDLQPEKILVDKRNSKIAISDLFACSNTKALNYVSHISYMAPEVQKITHNGKGRRRLLTGDLYNEAVDIWSLGSVIQAIMERDYNFYRPLQHDYYSGREWVEDIVRSCLQEDPSKRPQIFEVKRRWETKGQYVPSKVCCDINGSCIGDDSIIDIKELQKIDHGSFGEVIECEIRNSKNFQRARVAGKFPKGNRVVAYIMYEAQLLTRVQHPNIIQSLGVYTMQSDYTTHVVMLMKLFPLSLRHLIDSKDYEITYAVNHIVPQFLEGVRYIHEEMFPPYGGIHADLKPGNVLFDKATGRLAICDFNTAHRQHKFDEATAGTEAFMAPEQREVLQPQSCTTSYTEAVDIWSLGLTIVALVQKSNYPIEFEALIDLDPWLEFVYLITQRCLRINCKERPPISEIQRQWKKYMVISENPTYYEEKYWKSVRGELNIERGKGAATSGDHPAKKSQTTSMSSIQPPADVLSSHRDKEEHMSTSGAVPSLKFGLPFLNVS